MKSKAIINSTNKDESGSFPICNNCIHKIGVLSCKAFEIIPDEIIFGENKHRDILPGQKGAFVFKKRD